MSGTINIGRSNEDLSFRYKMPKLLTKVEGRGNGIRTVLVNMVDVAKALKVQPAYPTKFFGIELGAQSKYELSTDRAIVNGNHSANDLQKLLDKFIAIFVLCPTCTLPEIKMEVQTSKVKIDCAACGHNSILKTAHKLATYIIKNPPNSFNEAGESAKTKDKKEEKEKKGKKGKKVEDSNDRDTTTKPKKPVPEDSAEEPLPAPATAPATATDNSTKKEIKWFSDTSLEAQHARQAAEFAEMKHVEEALKKTTQEGKKTDDSNSNLSAAQMLQQYISTNNRSMSDIYSEIRRLQLARGLDEPQRFVMTLEALYTSVPPKNIIEQIPKYAPLFKRLNAEKASAKIVIGAFENLIAVIQPKLMKSYVSHVFKALYDSDVLDEDSIVQWADSPAESSWLVNNKQAAITIRENARPFIDWLKTADEEDDGEAEN